MGHEWPDCGVPMQLRCVVPTADGEWWATFDDILHGEMSLGVKLIERPEDGAVWTVDVRGPSRDVPVVEAVESWIETDTGGKS